MYSTFLYILVDFHGSYLGHHGLYIYTLRIQVCPKKGINPTILLWGWDWDHQTYSREGYGSLGIYIIYVCSQKCLLCQALLQRFAARSTCHAVDVGVKDI